MAGVSGLTGIQPLGPATGQPAYYSEGWVDPYEQIRGPAPEHAQATWNDPPAFPWLMIQEQGFTLPPDPVVEIGGVPGSLPPGSDPSLYASPTETGSHRAPWPSFSIEDFDPRDTEQAATRAQLNQDLHATDSGQPAAFTTRSDLATPWQRGDFSYESAGESLLQPVPDQLRGNLMASRYGGFESRTQGYGPVNEHGFDAAHVHQPQASTDLAGAYLWLTPAGRPVVVRPTGYRDWPVGPDSPFAGQVPGTGGLGDPSGAVIDTPPPAYAPGYQPQTAAALTGSDDTPWASW
jgi:hypothetical protein